MAKKSKTEAPVKASRTKAATAPKAPSPSKASKAPRVSKSLALTGGDHLPYAPINTGISAANLQAVADELQVILADETVLYTKTRGFHWNVEGPHFGSLHKLFEEQYEELAEIIDLVAERIRKLGHYAVGSLGGYLKIARLLEHEDKGGRDLEFLEALLDDHETVIRELRNYIDDATDTFKDTGTADFLTDIMRQHERMAWMLRAHLG